jgi:hypothetical protein
MFCIYTPKRKGKRPYAMGGNFYMTGGINSHCVFYDNFEKYKSFLCRVLVLEGCA